MFNSIKANNNEQLTGKEKLLDAKKKNYLKASAWMTGTVAGAALLCFMGHVMYKAKNNEYEPSYCKMNPEVVKYMSPKDKKAQEKNYEEIKKMHNLAVLYLSGFCSTTLSAATIYCAVQGNRNFKAGVEISL